MIHGLIYAYRKFTSMEKDLGTLGGGGVKKISLYSLSCVISIFLPQADSNSILASQKC